MKKFFVVSFMLFMAINNIFAEKVRMSANKVVNLSSDDILYVNANEKIYVADIGKIELSLLRATTDDKKLAYQSMIIERSILLVEELVESKIFSENKCVILSNNTIEPIENGLYKIEFVDKDLRKDFIYVQLPGNKDKIPSFGVKYKYVALYPALVEQSDKTFVLIWQCYKIEN